MASLDPASGESTATRLLFRARHRPGRWLGWDDHPGQLPIPGDSETTLSARLPEDPPNTAADADLSSASFTPLYRTDAEWAAELSSRTVHAVMHLAWIGQGEGRYRGQLGVYVRPRGRAGAACMALIAPLRHHAVCPALIRQIGQTWNTRAK